MLRDTALGQMLTRVATIDATRVFIEVSDNEVTKKVVELNQDQLRKGKNSLGEDLATIGGSYSDLTLELHPEKDRFTITLFDTGEYYESIKAEARTGGYFISSNPLKEDFGRSTNLFDRWGEEIEGLDKNSIAKLVSEILIQKYIDYLKKNIL